MLKNNRTHILVILMVLAASSLACGINLPTTAPAVPTSGPVVPPVEPTVQVPVPPTIEPTVEPTIQPAVTARAQIGSYLSIWLTYDPTLWTAARWIDGVNQRGEEVQVLGHQTLAGCSLHDNLGHGVPPNWSFGRITREIGGLIFQIDQFTDMNTNNPVLVIYQYPAGENLDSAKRIELEPGTSPYDCITAADAIIALSTADITH